MKEENIVLLRRVVHSEEFQRFYSLLTPNVQKKLDWNIMLIESLPILSVKIVKKLVNTCFYELRVSQGSEYRVILFAIDKPNLLEARKVLLLNGFVKKSTKDYKKEIKIAEKLLNDYLDGIEKESL